MNYTDLIIEWCYLGHVTPNDDAWLKLTKI